MDEHDNLQCIFLLDFISKYSINYLILSNLNHQLIFEIADKVLAAFSDLWFAAASQSVPID